MTSIQAQASAGTLVLTNFDLLCHIFTFVAAPPMQRSRPTRHYSSPLASYTTVCRGFHEITIRLLWRSLPGLFPLCHLFAPPNAQRPPRSGDDLKRREYLRKVVDARLYDDPQVWERFLWYTTRVRHIAHFSYPNDSPETVKLQLRLTQAVVVKNGGNTVLPLLHSIIWNARAPTDNCLVAFFAPTLRSATWSLQSAPNGGERRALLFRRLRESSPHLEKFELGSPSDSDDRGLIIGDLVVQELLLFERLRQLTIHCTLGIGPVTFLALVAKPNLTSLSVRNIPEPLNASSPPTLVRDLLELSIEGSGPALVRLFNLVRFEVLHSVTVHVDVEDSPSVQQETDEALKAFCDSLRTPSTLRNLTLRISDPGSGHGGADFNLRDLVRAALPLPEIRSFTFHRWHGLRPHINVADVAALTGAWPNLERLVLNAPSPSRSRSGIDAFPLDALHYIHAHCPRLRELDMNSIRLPILGVHAIPAPLNRAAPHALRYLGRSNLHVYADYRSLNLVEPEHVEALARYLLELFPAVDTEEYKQWVTVLETRVTSAPGNCYDGRRVLARMYTLTAERERDSLQ